MESLPLTARALRLRRLGDDEVVTRTLTGDPAAFVELHRRYRKRVVAACASRLNSPITAEDAAQETFLRVLRAAPQQIENVEAWLLTIARNVCIDITRRASRVETPSEEATFQDSLPVADSATELMRRDNARQVFLALRRLPTRYRTALTLREFHGMSSAEIAESMNVSLGAVDSMVSRARDSFGAAYAEASGFPRGCRDAVERIYRELGSGLDANESAELQAHIAGCKRCRAEYKRAHSPRYMRGLVPLLVAKMPSLNLLADAISRSAEAPAVMQSFPALTATAVATISAAVVLSPVAVNRVIQSRAAEQPSTEIARTVEGGGHETPQGEAATEIPVVATESTAAASAEGSETAPQDGVVVAVVGEAVESGAAEHASHDDASPGQPTVVADEPSKDGPEADKPATDPEPSGGDSNPGDAASPDGGDTPAEPPAAAEPPVAGSDGWGDLPDGAVFQEPEGVPTEAN